MLKLVLSLSTLLLLSGCFGGDGSDTDDNDRPSQARTIAANEAYTGALDVSDDYIDFYHFNVTTSQMVTIELNGSGNTDFDLVLHTPDGYTIDWSDDWDSEESISRFLDAGEYYVAVVAVSGSGGYELRVTDSNSTPSTPPSTSGDFSFGTPYIGYLSSTGDEQVFETTMTYGNLTVELTGPSSADFDLELLDQNGTRLTASTGIYSNETISYSVLEGNYIIRVYSFSGSGEFTMTANFQ